MYSDINLEQFVQNKLKRFVVKKTEGLPISLSPYSWCTEFLRTFPVDKSN